MLIENTQARLIHIQTGYVKNGEVGTAQYLSVMPGINDISDDTWLAALEYDGAKEHVACGDLVERAESPKQDGGLEAMDVVKALEVIKNTFKCDMLQVWLAAEKRTPVIAALDAQIKLMGGEIVDAKPTQEDPTKPVIEPIKRSAGRPKKY
jgi:hypothetical protein